MLTPAAWSWWPAVRIGQIEPGDPEVFPTPRGYDPAVPGKALLERDGELGVLAELVAQAAGGDGRAGLIQGPPAIGKTRLVAAARRLAAEAGMRCLSALARWSGRSRSA